MLPPTFPDIVAAREFIKPYLPKTPLVRLAKISEEPCSRETASKLLKARARGKKVVGIVSGGNITLDRFAGLMKS